MINPVLIDQLMTAAIQAAPFEMCGLLFSGDRLCLTTNADPDPARAFLLTHQDYLKACMVHDEKPWAIVHSHPSKGASPSVRDCQLMDALGLANQDLLMMIVGLQPREIRAFRQQAHGYPCVWVWSDAAVPV